MHRNSCAFQHTRKDQKGRRSGTGGEMRRKRQRILANDAARGILRSLFGTDQAEWKKYHRKVEANCVSNRYIKGKVKI